MENAAKNNIPRSRVHIAGCLQSDAAKEAKNHLCLPVCREAFTLPHVIQKHSINPAINAKANNCGGDYGDQSATNPTPRLQHKRITQVNKIQLWCSQYFSWASRSMSNSWFLNIIKLPPPVSAGWTLQGQANRPPDTNCAQLPLVWDV